MCWDLSRWVYHWPGIFYHFIWYFFSGKHFMLEQILFYNKFLFAQCFQTCYTIFLSHLHSRRWYLILEPAFIQNYRGCLEGVFTMLNLVTVLFLSIILRSVSAMLGILEHPYPFSIVLVILIFGLKGNSHIGFSVRMHVFAPVSILILIVWLANIFSVYLEIECTHLLLELIVPMLLDACSGSSSFGKSSYVWYSFYSLTSQSCCSYFLCIFTCNVPLSTISALWSPSRKLISVMAVSSTSITLLASCFR